MVDIVVQTDSSHQVPIPAFQIFSIFWSKQRQLSKHTFHWYWQQHRHGYNMFQTTPWYVYVDTSNDAKGPHYGPCATFCSYFVYISPLDQSFFNWVTPEYWLSSSGQLLVNMKYSAIMWVGGKLTILEIERLGELSLQAPVLLGYQLK